MIIDNNGLKNLSMLFTCQPYNLTCMNYTNKHKQ